MFRYLISFDDGSMDHIPARNMPAVGGSRCPRGTRRWCGPPGSPARVDAHRRSAKSCSTRSP